MTQPSAEELVKKWRDLAENLAPDYKTCPALAEAADLCERLVKKRDEAVIDKAVWKAECDALKAKLEKARTALEDVVKWEDDPRGASRLEKECRARHADFVDLKNREVSTHEKLATAVEALKEIAGSMRWGEDTAIKRTITAMQDGARAALAKIGAQ